MVASRLLLVLAAALATVACVPAAAAAAPPRSWPPPPAGGLFAVHFGEEHLTDADGDILLPQAVRETVRWRPDVLLTSGDKSDDGTEQKLRAYLAVLDDVPRAGIPWFAAVGNHDRQTPPGVPRGTSPAADLSPYLRVFAGQPHPFGDAPPPRDPRFRPRARPADDPTGASSHYAFDFGPVRVVMIDNSCFSITNCASSLQNPATLDQFAFLEARAAEAKAQGRQVWVVMHMPTQDPRDQLHAEQPNHTMGKGATPDNVRFEQAAARAGVDVVLLGHIKGQWEYRGAGGVPYYIDGGAGGELYTNDEDHVGVDTGYWYGYRLLHARGEALRTDVVPLLRSVSVEGPARAELGDTARFRAFGRQPARRGVKVERLELRDPDRTRPDGRALPTPARIWTSSRPNVLRPVAAADDDPRRRPRTQTTSGVFRAHCPGRARVTVTSGFRSASTVTHVRSRPGRIVRRLSRRERVASRGRSAKLATVRLAQPAHVLARVRRGGRTVAVLRGRCLHTTRPVPLRWRPGAVAPGRYVLDLRVGSDRRPVVRRWAFSVR